MACAQISLGVFKTIKGIPKCNRCFCKEHRYYLKPLPLSHHKTLKNKYYNMLTLTLDITLTKDLLELIRITGHPDVQGGLFRLTKLSELIKPWSIDY
jgi:hypothetical protein